MPSPGFPLPPCKALTMEDAALMRRAPPTTPAAIYVTATESTDFPLLKSATTQPTFAPSPSLLSSRVACRAISGTEKAIAGIFEANSAGITCVLEALNRPTGTGKLLEHDGRQKKGKTHTRTQFSDEVDLVTRIEVLCVDLLSIRLYLQQSGHFLGLGALAIHREENIPSVCIIFDVYGV